MVCTRPAAASASDRPPPPKLPLAQWWSVALEGPVVAGPVASGARVYLAYASGTLVARDAADGHELWRQKKDVTRPMAAEGDLLFVSTGEAIEALRGDTGASAWILPRTKTVAPLVAASGVLIATTDTEIIAAQAATGQVNWRRPAGGVTLAPVIDEGRLYTGAQDGRVLALQMTDGAQVWDNFLPGGITAIGAGGGRVFAGAGNKVFYALDGAKKGDPRSAYRLGSLAQGHIAVDDERVYVAAMDNVVRAFDRENGNQRWQEGLRERPLFGVFVSGHVVFAPAVASPELQMIYDRGGRSGALVLPGDAAPGLIPAIIDSAAGPIVFAITGGLTNEWNLTKFAPAGETGLIPLAQLDSMPGLPFLTDPELKAPAVVLQQLLINDPPLQPFSEIEWPVVLTDPPLVPLTVLPGLQLRPLSPVLPVRRAGRGPGG